MSNAPDPVMKPALALPENLGEDAALRAIFEGTATETGHEFFASLVKHLGEVLHTDGAWVTEYLPEKRHLRALAFWLGGEWILDYEYAIDGTVCEPVIDQAAPVHVPENVLALFPSDPDLKKFNAVSYLGHPLKDVSGRVLGHLAVLDSRPMPEEPRFMTVFRIFAARAAAELQRQRAETELREREAELSRLVQGAMDAIIELDNDLRPTLMNPAAEKLLGCSLHNFPGKTFADVLSEEDGGKLRGLLPELDKRGEGRQSLWIPGGFSSVRARSAPFPAEGTLARYEAHGSPYYLVVLRNVNERLEAERRIRSLTVEAEYLRSEIEAVHNFGEIVGQSRPLLRVLQEIKEVATTDATVLVFGETGTGKELIAHAIHAAGGRGKRPLVTVNCAAVPATLIESEFFGHEQGAFTGATKRREGRFALADGGTIFLDEIGELPLDLQGKLLRVLQEGEFEPVGSSHTRKVNVRVIAATNRDLRAEVAAGRFREDLYYRLNVFPIVVPPLRERGDDVVLLATHLAKQCAQRNGRLVQPLSADHVARLRAYSWPGNVRELANVIERAVITSRDGHLNLDRALPDVAPPNTAYTPAARSTDGMANRNGKRVLTADEWLDLERENLRCALEQTDWRVAGDNGAAKLLGVPPSTLSSRMKALGIQRPVRT
jgi:PAS domain S-box-containing protein